MTDQRPYSHHANFHGWEVEARINASAPRQLGEQIFDNRWQVVRFKKTWPPCGVPNEALFANALDECGLYGYEQAQALRWWFHASAPFFSGLETRLVSYKVKSDLEWSRVGEQESVGERPGLHQQPVSEEASQ